MVGLFLSFKTIFVLVKTLKAAVADNLLGNTNLIAIEKQEESVGKRAKIKYYLEMRHK